MGGFGGGSLEHLRWWLKFQWLGLFLGVPSRQSHQARLGEVQKASWSTTQTAL